MGPIWGRQDPDEPYIGPMNFAIWEAITNHSRMMFRVCKSHDFFEEAISLKYSLNTFHTIRERFTWNI